MFSSLTSFIFGSTTPAASDGDSKTGTDNGKQQQQDKKEPSVEPTQQQQQQRQRKPVRIDEANTIEVTSSTPSVTGSGSLSNKARQARRGKNKRQSKLRRQALAAAAQNVDQGKRTTPSIRKLLTPNESSEDDETFDEDDWFIVENDDEDDSLPRTDSEEELSIVEVKAKPTGRGNGPMRQNQPLQHVQHQQQLHHTHQHHHQQQHINSHSLYSGPRPQQQRNYLQRARNSGVRLNVSRPSPPRTAVASSSSSTLRCFQSGDVSSDGGVTQSLYAVPVSRGEDDCIGSSGGNCSLALTPNHLMEGSWYVTPPPCFTSIGPINMVTSPFENLLIEHPSMSVYHSIRSQAQEATESFVNLDLGVTEPQQQQPQQQQQQQKQQQQQQKKPAPSQRRPSKGETAPADKMAVVVARNRAPQTISGRNTQVVQARPHTVRFVVYNAAQLKQELLSRQSQKSQEKRERQNFCRNAMKRANKASDFSGKATRRLDMQYTKIQQPRFNKASNNSFNNGRKSAV